MDKKTSELVEKAIEELKNGRFILLYDFACCGIHKVWLIDCSATIKQITTESTP